MNDLVKSATRVLDMLEFFSSITEPLGVSDIAKRLDIPKSSAQALLLTLTTRGYLARNGSNYYLAHDLRGGWIGGMRPRLLNAATPAMERMVAESGESAFIGILAGNQKIQYLAKISSPQEVRYDAPLDPLRPAHCTSMGIAILSHTPGYDPGKEKLESFTPSTVIDPQKFARMLTDAKRNGYAEIVDAHVEGASGVSAPIFDHNNNAIAALNLGAPTWRYKRNRELLIATVCREAEIITRNLAGTHTP